MEEKIYNILKQVQEGKLFIGDAQSQLLSLFDVSDCFTIGAKIQITKCIHGHEYKIGEVVTIIGHEPTENSTTSWLCSNINGEKWYIREEEGVPFNCH